MQNHLVNAHWSWCDKKHIRLDFSDSIDQVGRFALWKSWRLLRIVLAVWKERLRGKIDVLFYPPCGRSRIPFYRDVLLLFLVRWCSRRLIFQFHAGGFNLLQQKLSAIERWIARKVYRQPDAAIVLLPSLAAETRWIDPKHTFVVPNGIEDCYHRVNGKHRHDIPRILFVGTLTPKKGILDAIEACRQLQERKVPFSFLAVGDFSTEQFKKTALNLIARFNLSESFHFSGVKVGEDKWREYVCADVFCFPTYETENLPVVILEAMQFALPIVATRWRGISDVITDGEDGFLVPVRDPAALALKIELLVCDKELRIRMGKMGREKYLQQYSLSQHLDKIEQVFRTVANF